MGSTSFTVRSARDNFRDVLDSAQDAQPSTVVRNGHEFVVIDKSPLINFLQTTARPKALITYEDEASVVVLEDLPFAAEANSLEEAVSLLIEDLRDYAEHWAGDFQHAPNHKNNWGLVTVINLLNDDDLSKWIIGS